MSFCEKLRPEKTIYVQVPNLKNDICLEKDLETFGNKYAAIVDDDFCKESDLKRVNIMMIDDWSGMQRCFRVDVLSKGKLFKSYPLPDYACAEKTLDENKQAQFIEENNKDKNESKSR